MYRRRRNTLLLCTTKKKYVLFRRRRPSSSQRSLKIKKKKIKHHHCFRMWWAIISSTCNVLLPKQQQETIAKPQQNTKKLFSLAAKNIFFCMPTYILKKKYDIVVRAIYHLHLHLCVVGKKNHVAPSYTRIFAKFVTMKIAVKDIFTFYLFNLRIA